MFLATRAATKSKTNAQQRVGYTNYKLEDNKKQTDNKKK